MTRLRDPRWLLILLFLGIIASVALVQIFIEVLGKDGVRALEIFDQAPTAENLRAYERRLEAANWMGKLSRPWLQFARFAWLKDGGEKTVIGRGGWHFYKPGLNYMLARPEPEKTQNAMHDPITAIVDFRDQLAARGVHLLLMPVPNKESIYPDQVSSRAEGLRQVVSPRTQEILKRLRSADVEFVDLFKEFGEARQQTGSAPPPFLYLAQDTHWSPAGVDLAAKAVARRLTELGWVQTGQVNYRERAAPVPRLGDIVRMLQIPMIERVVPPENVSCFEVVRQDNGELYKDGSEADVLVLGDSFMRIYQQDAPTSAGFIAHLAKELKRPLMSLVNDGGGATLVRQELSSRPIFLKNKKVVVWEFVERDIGLAIEGWKLVALPAQVSTNSPVAQDHSRAESPKSPTR